LLDSLFGRVQVGVAGHEYDYQIRINLPAPANQLDAVHIGHANVGYYQIGLMRFEMLQRPHTVGGRPDLKPLVLQGILDQRADDVFVVGDDYSDVLVVVFGHSFSTVRSTAWTVSDTSFRSNGLVRQQQAPASSANAASSSGSESVMMN